jgi:hypothetical protein
MNTPPEPAAKKVCTKGMVEDSEGEEDGTASDADGRRWMEAEHMEAEPAEKDADEEVQGGLDPLTVYDAPAEEAKRPLTKQRSCLMESEGTEGEEAAQARPGGGPSSQMRTYPWAVSIV